MKILMRLLLLLIFISSTALAQRPATLRGQVSDELGAVIVGATVTLTNTNRETRTANTDTDGIYRLNGLHAGTYSIEVTQPGFAPFQQGEVTLVEGQPKILNITLRIASVQGQVTVDQTTAVNTDPAANKSATVLRGNELNALADDPNELAAELSALSGPAAGPGGAQVLVDGFTAGPVLPDKQSIREIVINQNPFSAEWERIGFGNIQILTRPGTGKLHGSGAFTFSDAVLNSRNPYAGSRPDYQRRIYDGNLNGPLSSRASFFLSFGRREVDDAVAVNAVILNSALQPVPFNEAVVTPRRINFIGPRFDFQINRSNTLSARYNYNSSDLQNQGVGNFSLGSRGFSYEDQLHLLQVINNTVINPTTTNEAAFQYIWYYIQQNTNDPASGLIVLESFSGGGSQIGQYSFTRGEGEVRDYVTMQRGQHSLKFGARLRWAHIADTAPTNFDGTYTFAGGKGPQLDSANQIVPGALVDLSSIERYRRTLLFQQMGMSGADIRLRGGGASQLTIATGGAFAEVRQWDLAPFIQDDWKLRPNFTLSLGLRYQLQTNIDSSLLFAPRLSFAWTPWARGNGTPKTVVRGGAGIFYDIVRTNITLQANRFNGSNQTQYIVDDPVLLNLFPNVPSDAVLAALQQPQTVWLKESRLTQPYYLQSSISVERSLPRNVILSLSYVNTRGVHQLRARNINAPVTGLGPQPFPTSNNLYQFESGGIYKQQLFVVNTSMRLNPRFSLNANYTYGKGDGDTDGPFAFPAQSYDLTSEFGRTSFDIRHRFALTGNFETRWGVAFSPLIVAQSGAPFNITTGTDLNNDSIFADRPSFASDLSRPSVKFTEFGAFDLLPLPGSAIIPRNLGHGPAYFSVNLRVAKTFSFGSVPPPANGRPAQGSEARPYRFTVSIAVANVFNHTNPGTPIGNLSSPGFGLSNSLAAFTPLATGGSASTSNRSVALRGQFSF